MNPDPDVVEVNLRASVTTWQYIPGVDTTVWAYNDQVPGPTIRAKVGDLLRVNFTNDLPEPTTIHWHGVELPAAMDGSHISQAHIQPGESFTYEFPLLRDGLYWYHPHVRTFDQVELGLHGTLLVHDAAKEKALGLDQIEEHIVVFDDVLLDANNQVVPAFSFSDPLQNSIYHVNGREGNVLLVNGRKADQVSLPVPNGRPQRWRCVNVANSTFCRIGINDPIFGVTAQLWEIGTDGGFLEKPHPRGPIVPFSPTKHPTLLLIGPMSEGILLLPGERLDVIFTPTGQDGEAFRTFQHDWIRGRHTANYGLGGTIILSDDPQDGYSPKQPYFEIVVQGPDPGLGEYVPPAKLGTIPNLPSDPVGVLPVALGHGNPDLQGNVPLFAQASFAGGVMTPLPAPKVDSFKAHDVNLGEAWLWQVTNLTHGDHPFHVHGFFFEPLEYEFQDDLVPQLNFTIPFTRKMLKDTIRAPARGNLKGTSRSITRLLTYFEDRGTPGETAAHGQTATYDANGDWTSGGWLFHCHVLEHSGKGMLSFYEVHEPGETTRLLGKSLPGTLGKPSLTTRGTLTPGSALSIDLVNGLPSQPVILAIGFTTAMTPFAGGTIVASLDILWNGMTDAAGDATWSTSAWQNLATGAEAYLQAAFVDPGATQGWAFSNALRVTRP